MTRSRLACRIVAAFLFAGVTGAAFAQTPPPAPAPVYTPTQVAWLQAEIRRAQQRFAQQASAISGVHPEKVMAWLPRDWRAGDPRFAVIPALERERGARLSEDQRAEINAADREMKADILRARAEAAQR
ncbi:MAG: hypothetical protein HY778_18045 [Betaproteobacteria bacterium]|nr:hypothetical protein [Betaproteobacteria bacterium]